MIISVHTDATRKGAVRFRKLFAAMLSGIVAFSLVPALPVEACATEDEISISTCTGDHSAQQRDNANSWRYENGSLIDEESTGDTQQSQEPIDQLAIVDNGGYKAFDSFDAYEDGYCPSDGAYKGIDVSEHNGEIDWRAVKSAGVDYAIIRCGYGKDRPSQDDKRWKQNVADCQAAGISFGVYIYSYADCEECALSEAEHVLRCLSEVNLGSHFRLPIYFDMEDKSMNGCDYAAIASAFCERIQAAGYKVGVYANSNWWTNRLTSPVFDNWCKWVAQYNTWGLGYKKFNKSQDVWQFSSAGSIPGINHKTDLNYSHAPFIKRIDFDDVSPHAWYYEPIGQAKELSYINGYAGTSYFGPNNNITRAEAVCVLYNMANRGAALASKEIVDDENGNADSFVDVDPEAFYAEAVGWAKSVGVVYGYAGTDEFRPALLISREQFACMLWNYAKVMGHETAFVPDPSGCLVHMPDENDVSDWAYAGTEWAVYNNVMGNGGYISPQNAIIRAEVAAMAINYQPASL